MIIVARVQNGEVSFLKEKMDSKDIIGVVLHEEEKALPSRLMLRRKIDGSCEVLYASAHQALHGAKPDSISIMGNIPNSDYTTLLSFMKEHGLCKQDEEFVCATDLLRDLFPSN